MVTPTSRLEVSILPSLINTDLNPNGLFMASILSSYGFLSSALNRLTMYFASSRESCEGEVSKAVTYFSARATRFPSMSIFTSNVPSA